MKKALKFILLLCCSTAFASSKWNMPVGVTPISREIHDLHMTIFYICCVIGIIVFSVLIYSLIKFRHSKGVKPANFHENMLVEVIWAIIPFFILVGMAVPATRVLMHMHDTADPTMTIKITGYQWKWQYEYLDQGIKFFSNLSTPQNQINNEVYDKDKWFLLEVDHPIVVPTHQKIRFLMTANDVIHSWWVPDLGIKQDAIPGYINEAWAVIEKPGVYRGQCAELCGAHHGFMPIVVHAVDQIEFDHWVSEQNSSKKARIALANKNLSKAELMEKGKTAYVTYCSACHKADGKGMPPAFPGLIDNAITTGDVAKHIDIVVHGVKNTAMQAFGNQLDDVTLAAIITYERNAWGNDNSKAKVKIVQPSDVKAAKK